MAFRRYQIVMNTIFSTHHNMPMDDADKREYGQWFIFVGNCRTILQVDYNYSVFFVVSSFSYPLRTNPFRDACLLTYKIKCS